MCNFQFLIQIFILCVNYKSDIFDDSTAPKASQNKIKTKVVRSLASTSCFQRSQ